MDGYDYSIGGCVVIKGEIREFFKMLL